MNIHILNDCHCCIPKVSIGMLHAPYNDLFFYPSNFFPRLLFRFTWISTGNIALCLILLHSNNTTTYGRPHLNEHSQYCSSLYFLLHQQYYYTYASLILAYIPLKSKSCSLYFEDIVTVKTY
jgi:hypothetical protein